MLWIDFHSDNTKFRYFDYRSDNTISSILFPTKEGKFILDLNSSHVQLDTPLFVSITPKNGDYYVEQEQLNLWSRDTDMDKAITDIKSQIVVLYCHLKNLIEENLGPQSKEQLKFLHQYIKK